VEIMTDTPNRSDLPPAAKYRIVYDLLAAAYGEPDWRPALPPLDELVSTILSQSTSDTNRDRAFNRVKERFSDWAAVMDAPLEEVVEAIRPAGLANQKAPRIQAALRHIMAETGALSLDFLADLPLEEAQAWLQAIHGVGPKTAAIVLLFAFGRPAFPVDTHVHRVSGRLGLIGPKVTADKAHGIMQNLGRPDSYYAMHLNLIRHGREVCTARSPRCSECILKAYCDYYQRIVVAGRSAGDRVDEPAGGK
jgi:endonuclease-3